MSGSHVRTTSQTTSEDTVEDTVDDIVAGVGVVVICPFNW